MAFRFINFIVLIIIAIVLLPLAGCTIGGANWSVGYKFSGVVIPSDIKTASVPQIQNKALLVQPTLALNLTEKLRDKILDQTRLKVVSKDGDVNFEVIISEYNTTSEAPQGGNVVTAALNRLTIKVDVKYTNSKDSKADFEQSFSRSLTFLANTNLSEVEKSDTKYEEMLNELITDIFNKAFVNW